MFAIIYHKLQDMIQPLQGKTEEAQLALESFANKKTTEIVNELSNYDEIVKFRRVKIDDSFEQEKYSDGKQSSVENRYDYIDKS